jgi:hypothetical protein
MVLSGDAVRNEPMKKIARSLAPTPRADPQLFPRSKAFQRRRGGFEQQGESHYEVFAPTGYSNWPFITSLGKLPEPESTHDFF